MTHFLTITAVPGGNDTPLYWETLCDWNRVRPRVLYRIPPYVQSFPAAGQAAAGLNDCVRLPAQTAPGTFAQARGRSLFPGQHLRVRGSPSVTPMGRYYAGVSY